MKIKVPQGRILEAEVLENFRRERDRINALMETGRPSQRVATEPTSVHQKDLTIKEQVTSNYLLFMMAFAH